MCMNEICDIEEDKVAADEPAPGKLWLASRGDNCRRIGKDAV